MLLLVTFLLFIILVSRITEEVTKIPSTLAVIFYAFMLSLLFPELFAISSEEFDDILYLMLPVILLPDILNISIKELKLHAKEIFYLAVISVVGSIAIATFITPYILPEYQFTVGMLIALFTMLMATDAITVTAIMSKFKLPERLKIYAESESLFNDVTALIIFYFIALPLISGSEVTLLSINYTLFKVVILSTVIGMAIAYLGFLSIKILKNPVDQFVIIYLVVTISFLIAEYFNIAGVLSIVASVLMFKFFIQKELDHEKERRNSDEIFTKHETTYSIIELIKRVPAVTKHEFREYKKEAMFIGIFANAIVFVIIANLVDLTSLFDYSYEILVIFTITTVIRFMSITSLIVSIKLPFRWAKTLTLSGTKGALAIIMVHSLPESFIYKEMFNAIVIGNVLITTFIYTLMLMTHIKLNSQQYANDMQSEIQMHTDSMVQYTKNLVDHLEKEHLTHAYNRPFIEEILIKELMRAQRYKVDLSLLVLQLSCKKSIDKDTLEFLGETITQNIRVSDYFGKLKKNEYLIIASNTSLSGAVILAEKISDELKIDITVKPYFGVTQAADTDDIQSVLEKLSDALSRSYETNGHHIEIEV